MMYTEEITLSVNNFIHEFVIFFPCERCFERFKVEMINTKYSSVISVLSKDRIF